MLDWNQFRKLTGDPRLNFERLWRQLIGCRYGAYGVFREFKNMPGVEFVLELTRDCESLGKKGDKIGWQCKFPDRLEVDGTLNSDTKTKFHNSLVKCSKRLDKCYLCSHCTKILEDDVQWISNESKELGLQLEWCTEESLSMLFEAVDNGKIIKETYFGSLVLDRAEFSKAFRQSIAPVKHRYIPAVIEMTDVEREIRHKLLERSAWDRDIPQIPECVWRNQSKDETYSRIIKAMKWVESRKKKAKDNREKYDGIWDWRLEVCRSVRQDAITCVGTFLVGVIADAGCGKTCLGISICQEVPNGRPAGAFFLARDLRDGNLDSLARTFQFRGRSAHSMDEVLSVLNVAGQAHGCKMPLVIDGLNESSNPAEWQPLLSRLVERVDKDYPHVLVIVTLRSGRVAGQRYSAMQDDSASAMRYMYAELCIPKRDDRYTYPLYEMTRWEAQRMMEKYFSYYKIQTEDERLPDSLCHPLALSLYCQYENKDRTSLKRVPRLPHLLAGVFHDYVDKVAKNIAQGFNAVTSLNAKKAIAATGGAFLRSGVRYVKDEDLRSAIEAEGLPKSIDWCRILTEEGLVVNNLINGESLLECTYDALGGYLIADYLLIHNTRSDEWVGHKLADDIAASLLSLYASRNDKAYVREMFPNVDRFVFAKHVVHLPDDIAGDWAASEILYAASKDSGALGNAIDRCLHHLYEDGDLHGSQMLDALLKQLTPAYRDLIWGRRILEKHDKWHILWKDDSKRDNDNLILCKWLLSSTCITIRDRATHVLHNIGLRNPTALLDAVIDALSINDSYIVERMAAVGYGAAMCLNITRNAGWSESIISYAERIINTTLKKNAPHPSSHKWVLDALVNTVALAKHIDRECKSRILLNFRIPYKTWYSPFRFKWFIKKASVKSVEKAFGHDFEYYDLPHLIGEYNYRTESSEYERARNKIARRMYDLGYRYADFEHSDMVVGGYSGRKEFEQDGLYYETVGRKYASIAYAEMEPWARKINKKALIFAEDKMPPRLIRDYARGERSYWTPFFWPMASQFPFALPELVIDKRLGMPHWLTQGGVPNIDSILSGDVFRDGQDWILLHGYIEQERDGVFRVSERIDGILSTDEMIAEIEANGVSNCDYNPIEYNEPIYWEFPWSRQCTWDPNTGEIEGRLNFPNVQSDVEVPYCSVGTGSRHEGGKEDVSRFAWIPSLTLIRALNLKPSTTDLNWYDAHGDLAVRFYAKFERFNRNDPDNYQLLFIRKDLLEKYAQIRELKFAQRCFGERYPGMDIIDKDVAYLSKKGIAYQEKEFAYLRSPIKNPSSVSSFEERARNILMLYPHVKIVLGCATKLYQTKDSLVWPQGGYADDVLMFSKIKDVKAYGDIDSKKQRDACIRAMFIKDPRSVFIVTDGGHNAEASVCFDLLTVLKTVLCLRSSLAWYFRWGISRIVGAINLKVDLWKRRRKKPFAFVGARTTDWLIPIDGMTFHLVPCIDEANGVYVVSSLLAKENGAVRDFSRGSKEIGECQVDDIWVHGMWMPKEWFTCWRTLKAGKRLIRMVHGSLSPVYLKRKGGFRKWLVGPIERYFLRRAVKIVATCEAEKEWIKAYLGKRCPQIEVMNIKRFFNLPQSGAGTLPSDRPLHLLYLGRRHPLKGLVCLEEAIKGAVGVELRVVSNAFGEEKEKVWGWCDVLVLPTLSENFGLVIAEALERGKRVITTDGAPAWSDGNDYGGRLIYLKGFRDGTEEKRIELLRSAIEALACHS